MKKLNMEQLRELRVFNPWNFAGDKGWFLDFTAHSRQTMGTFGWHLNCPSKPSGQFHPHHRISGMGLRGNLHPSTFVAEAGLDRVGATPPKEWVKFMGAWWDSEFVKTRMAELVERYKARVTP